MQKNDNRQGLYHKNKCSSWNARAFWNEGDYSRHKCMTERQNQSVSSEVLFSVLRVTIGFAVGESWYYTDVAPHHTSIPALPADLIQKSAEELDLPHSSGPPNLSG